LTPKKREDPYSTKENLAFIIPKSVAIYYYSDENRKVQRWIKYVWNVENDRPEEKGAFTLLELSQKGSGELEKSYEQHNDTGNADGNTVGKRENARLAGSTMQQKKNCRRRQKAVPQ